MFLAGILSVSIFITGSEVPSLLGAYFFVAVFLQRVVEIQGSLECLSSSYVLPGSCFMRRSRTRYAFPCFNIRNFTLF